MYRYFTIFLSVLLSLSVIGSGQQSEYQEELDELSSLITEWKNSDAPEELKGPIAAVADALAAMIGAADCFRVDDFTIQSFAESLAALTNSMSYPCNLAYGGQAYTTSRELDALAREIADKASMNGVAATERPPIDPDKTDIVDGNPAACSVQLATWEREIWVPLGRGALRMSNRFEERELLARAYPSGGTFTWLTTVFPSERPVALEQYGLLNGEEVSSVVGKFSLKPPVPDAFYAITVVVRYEAPNGAVCDTRITTVYEP